jgi:hypothetical protein
MRYFTILAVVLSGAALFCACSSEEGPVNSKPVVPAGPEESIFGSVSGFCKDSGGSGENFIACYVCDPMTGEESFSFYPAFSETDPLLGAGFYECDRVPFVAPPLDGTVLVVIGYDRGEFWGMSDPFVWTNPSVMGVIVNEE